MVNLQKNAVILAAIAMLLCLPCAAGQSLGIEVDQILFKVLVKSSGSIEKQLRITNTGTQAKSISIEIHGLAGIANAYPKSIQIGPGQSESANIVFSAEGSENDAKPGVYTGKISVLDGENSVEIPAIVEIESKNAFLDMNLNPISEKNVQQGKDASIEVSLFNLLSIDSINVEIDYYIKDMENNVLLLESETVVVKSQASFFKTISIPKSMKEGQYVFAAEAKFRDSVGTSSYVFQVTKKESAIINFCRSGRCSDYALYASFLLSIMLILHFAARSYRSQKNTVGRRIILGISEMISSWNAERLKKREIASRQKEIVMRQKFREKQEKIRLAKEEMEKNEKEREAEKQKIIEQKRMEELRKNAQEQERVRRIQAERERKEKEAEEQKAMERKRKEDILKEKERQEKMQLAQKARAEEEKEKAENEKARRMGLLKSKASAAREKISSLKSKLAGIRQEKALAIEKIGQISNAIKELENEISVKSSAMEGYDESRKREISDYRSRQASLNESMKEERNDSRIKERELLEQLHRKEIEMEKSLAQELKGIRAGERKKVEKWKRMKVKAELKLEEEKIRGIRSRPKSAEELRLLRAEHEKTMADIEKKVALAKKETDEVSKKISEAESDKKSNESRIKNSDAAAESISGRLQALEGELQRIESELNPNDAAKGWFFSKFLKNNRTSVSAEKMQKEPAEESKKYEATKENITSDYSSSNPVIEKASAKRSRGFVKCKNLIEESRNSGDKAKAAQLYMKARQEYVLLDYSEKKEIYNELLEAFNILEKK